MVKTKFQDFWKKTVGKVVIISGFLAGVATFLTSLGAIKDFFKSATNDKGVQFVDVTIGFNDTIDIKLRNNGKEVAFIKRIEVDFKKSWKLVPDGGTHYIYIEPDEVYNINIDSKKEAPFVISTNISQGIKPNETDRFLLSLHNNMYKNYTYVYLADIKLIMNEDNTTITKPDVLFSFELPLQKYTKPNEDNKRVIREIETGSGYKSEPLVGLLEKIKMQ